MPDYTSDEDESFFGAIGRLTVAWGHIEFALDALVALLHVKLGGRDTIERVMPWSLKRKVDYIKRFFRKQYPSSWGTNAMCALMDAISTASEARHDIIHGVTVEHPKGSGEATLIRLIRERDILQQKYVHVTTADILKHAATANQIATRLSEAVLGLTAAIIENEADEPSSKT